MFKFTVNSQHSHCDFDFHRSESLNFTFELQPLILSNKKKRRKKERNKQKTSKKKKQKKQRKKVTTSLLTTIHLINNFLSAFYIIEHFVHFLCAFKNHSLCIFYYISTQQDVNLRRCGYSSPTRCQTGSTALHVAVYISIPLPHHHSLLIRNMSVSMHGT